MNGTSNCRMQEVTGEHPKGITVVLQALARDGLLTQQNQRQWASYRVAGGWGLPPIADELPSIGR